jgi:hypothetical protein
VSLGSGVAKEKQKTAEQVKEFDRNAVASLSAEKQVAGAALQVKAQLQGNALVVTTTSSALTPSTVIDAVMSAEAGIEPGKPIIIAAPDIDQAQIDAAIQQASQLSPENCVIMAISNKDGQLTIDQYELSQEVAQSLIAKAEELKLTGASQNIIGKVFDVLMPANKSAVTIIGDHSVLSLVTPEGHKIVRDLGAREDQNSEYVEALRIAFAVKNGVPIDKKTKQGLSRNKSM